ncbi:MAG: thioredoxin family (seleno)protein, partial [Myxococcota bacterium]
MRALIWLLFSSACAGPIAPAAATESTPITAVRTDPVAQPHELGQIAWIRDLEAGKAEAKSTGKPLLLLFTEVPGCSTVNGFADAALEDPLFVEATEDLFVPVVIY